MKKIMQDILRVLLYLAIYVVYQSLFVALFLVGAGVYYSYKTGGMPTPDMLPENYMVWAMSIGMFLAAVAGIITFVGMNAVKFRKGFCSSVPNRALFYSVVIIFSSIFALNIGVSYLDLPDMLANEFDGLSHNVVGVLSIAVVVPVLEEVLFRGAIQGRLMRRYRSPWLAIIVSALIFGIIHFNPIQTVYATLLGIVFGWIYYRTQSLLPVILGHVLNNTFATITMYMEKGAEEIEAADWTMLPYMVIFASFAIYFAYRLHSFLPKVAVPWREIGEEEPAEYDAESI